MALLAASEAGEFLIYKGNGTVLSYFAFDDLLDGVIRDLLPLRKGFPSLHLILDHLLVL